MKKVVKITFVFTVMLVALLFCAEFNGHTFDVCHAAQIDGDEFVPVKTIAFTNIVAGNLTLAKNEAFAFETKVAPKNASDQGISWVSTDPSVASVDANGVVHALKDGTTQIIATPIDGSHVSACVVLTVGVPVELLHFDNHTITVVSGEKTPIPLQLFPTCASNTKMHFYSDNESVAKINQNGIITGRLKGKTNITVKSDDSRVKNSLIVRVIYPSVRYTMKRLERRNVSTIINELFAIKASKAISKNKTIASVSSKGTIKALKKGSCIIRVKRTTSIGYVDINLVVGKPVSKINLVSRPIQVHKNSVISANASVYPKKASNPGLTYSIEDSSIATVDTAGEITAHNVGETLMHIFSDDGRKSTTVTVKVGDAGAEIQRDTSDGTILGKVLNYNVVAWLGVPYARPPVGDLRWRAPQDSIKWDEVRVTDTAKQLCTQFDSGEIVGSEDCLYMNIYRPNTTQKNLPILVFMHGGSNLNGSKTSFTGTQLSSPDVTNSIIISIDYRLNAFGWLNLPALKTGNPEEDSGNFALLDAKKALEWVKQNAEVFGGDSNNITLGGFSAGGRNVLGAVISPIFKGLFNRALIMSVGMATSTPQQGENAALKNLAELVVEKGLATDTTTAKEWLKETDSEMVRDFLYNLSSSEVVRIFTSMNARMSVFPHMYTDGYVIPLEGFNVLNTGDYNKVPFFIGTDANEFASFSLSSTRLSGTFQSGQLMIDDRLGYLGIVSNYFGSRLFTSYNLENTVENLYKNADQPPIYAYRMKWGQNESVTGSPYYSSYIGACHGMTRKFLLNSFSSSYSDYAPDLFGEVNKQGRLALTARIRSYLKNFLWNGNPNEGDSQTWTPWTNADEEQRVMIFDASLTEDHSKMSSEYLKKADLLIETTNSVRPDFLPLLMNQKADDGIIGIFYDRVFMVEYINQTTPPSKTESPDDTDPEDGESDFGDEHVGNDE